MSFFLCIFSSLRNSTYVSNVRSDETKTIVDVIGNWREWENDFNFLRRNEKNNYRFNSSISNVTLKFQGFYPIIKITSFRAVINRRTFSVAVYKFCLHIFLWVRDKVISHSITLNEHHTVDCVRLKIHNEKHRREFNQFNKWNYHYSLINFNIANINLPSLFRCLSRFD